MSNFLDEGLGSHVLKALEGKQYNLRRFTVSSRWDSVDIECFGFSATIHRYGRNDCHPNQDHALTNLVHTCTCEQQQSTMVTLLDFKDIQEKVSTHFRPWQRSFQFWLRTVDIYTGYKVFISLSLSPSIRTICVDM